MGTSSSRGETRSSFRSGLLAGQTALVSGAGSGIGRAIAVRFAELGADVAVCGRREAPLRETAAIVEALGRRCSVHPMTIRDPIAVAGLVDSVWQHHGQLHILINNAGGQFAQAAIDFSAKGWAAVIDTNLNGPWYMMQAAARRWQLAGTPACIVNIVTVIARGQPGIAHTCAARAGVIYLSKTLAVEWAPLGIRVNCIAPGIVDTGGLDVYSEAARRGFSRGNPMRRLGDTQDIAEACCYVAGPSGKFMTGEVLTLDGGGQLWGEQWTIPRPGHFDEWPQTEAQSCTDS